MHGMDSAGHRYEEFAMSANEHIRVTLAPYQSWADGPTLRIQKRDYRGHTVPGPEFPARLAGELAKALHDVLVGGQVPADPMALP